MQFFNFIFLARSWAADSVYLASRLAQIGTQNEQDDKPLSLILYPEGTLVSGDTRPISKKYADKLGIVRGQIHSALSNHLMMNKKPDLVHTLLPRSTGLHYCLQSLAPRIASLHLIDITVAYPGKVFPQEIRLCDDLVIGIPLMGYGQSYYTLRSIFRDRIPPPSVHMHIRIFNVAKDVPIGDLSSTELRAVPECSALNAAEVDIRDEDKARFDLWLRELWEDKDRLLDRFYKNGSFMTRENTKKTEIHLPLRLRHTREILVAFCFFLPATLGYISGMFRR